MNHSSVCPTTLQASLVWFAIRPHITCTSQLYSNVQQPWGITYNCSYLMSVQTALSWQVVFDSVMSWHAQRERERGREDVGRKRTKRAWETDRETSHSTAPGCETLPIFSSHADLFLSDRIISMHSTGEWKLPFMHKNMARIVNYPRGLFFSLCHPFAYCSYEKVLLM